MQKYLYVVEKATVTKTATDNSSHSCSDKDCD